MSGHVISFILLSEILLACYESPVERVAEYFGLPAQLIAGLKCSCERIQRLTGYERYPAFPAIPGEPFLWDPKMFGRPRNNLLEDACAKLEEQIMVLASLACTSVALWVAHYRRKHSAIYVPTQMIAGYFCQFLRGLLASEKASTDERSPEDIVCLVESSSVRKLEVERRVDMMETWKQATGIEHVYRLASTASGVTVLDPEDGQRKPVPGITVIRLTKQGKEICNFASLHHSFFLAAVYLDWAKQLPGSTEQTNLEG